MSIVVDVMVLGGEWVFLSIVYRCLTLLVSGRGRRRVYNILEQSVLTGEPTLRLLVHIARESFRLLH